MAWILLVWWRHNESNVLRFFEWRTGVSMLQGKLRCCCPGRRFSLANGANGFGRADTFRFDQNPDRRPISSFISAGRDDAHTISFDGLYR